MRERMRINDRIYNHAVGCGYTSLTLFGSGLILAFDRRDVFGKKTDIIHFLETYAPKGMGEYQLPTIPWGAK